MGAFKQPRESLPVVAWTPDYRLYANIHLVPGKSTADLLNAAKKDFIPLTDVRLFPQGYDDPPDPSTCLGCTPFFGLNRAKTLWISGGQPSARSVLSLKEVKVALIFHQNMIGGTMKIPPTARVTDHLCSSGPFYTVFNARLYPMVEGQNLSAIKPAARFEFVVVNSVLATGVIEG